MARRRTKNISIDEQIETAAKELENLQATVQEKQSELDSLRTQKAEDDKRRLLDAVLASGRSVDEAISLLS